MKATDKNFAATLEAKLNVYGPRLDLFLSEWPVRKIGMVPATIKTWFYPPKSKPFTSEVEAQACVIDNRVVLFLHGLN